jgi:pSer/pThr/pTyr-binding forkhead associated (FHA) protein
VSARLIGRTGPTAGQDYLLTGVTSIGASPDNQIRIAAPGVSRKHARIVVENDQYVLEDTGATNGTFLNGGRVMRETLRHLDVITLGRAVDLIFIRRDTGNTDVPSDQITAARVQLTDGPEAGTVVDVPKGETTFGRAPSCNVVLASGLVSKVHARIQRTSNQLLLQDLQSINGTFVNGERVDSIQVLRNGDVINFAGVRIVSVAIEGPAAALRPTVTAAPAADEPAFNQDWKTRFLWAPDELAAIEAARAEAMQLAALRNAAVAKPAAASKPAAPSAAKPAAPAKPPAAPAIAKPAVEAPPIAPKPAAAVKPPAAAVPPKPPPPVKADEVPVKPVTPPIPPPASGQAQARVASPAGPAQAAVQHAAAPVKPGSPIPVTKDPASATVPETPKPATPADAARHAAAAPPIAAVKPPAVVPPTPPQAPPREAEDDQTILTTPDDQTFITSLAAPRRVRGLKLIGVGPPISVGLGTFVVGRAIGSDVRLDDRQVSRSHARLTIDESSAAVEDLQTVNGTLVNGKEVKARQPLRHGDTVQFGASEFTVEVITT